MTQIHHVKLGQHRIIYKKHGHGPPLLLIHGIAASMLWWNDNIATLSTNYTVYSVDLMGFGSNRASAPLPVEQTADLLADFIEAMGYQTMDIVAHSLGGFISLLLAARHPQRVASMVLAAAAGGRAMRAGMLEMMIRALLSGFVCRPQFIPIVCWDTLRAGPIVLWKAATQLMQYDLQPYYAHIRAPILFVWGDQDILVPMYLGLQHHKQLPHSQFTIIDNAGHVVMNDQASVFNQIALGFLQSNSLRSA
jgi:pimeloyl-ACP methyl ester carboxylesterase